MKIRSTEKYPFDFFQFLCKNVAKFGAIWAFSNDFLSLCFCKHLPGKMFFSSGHN
jgi:hypothetical protein